MNINHIINKINCLEYQQQIQNKVKLAFAKGYRCLAEDRQCPVKEQNNDLISVGIVQFINSKSIMQNIIGNYKQNYIDKKLYLITNEDIDFFDDNIELIKFDQWCSIGFCIDQTVNLIKKKVDICAIFNNDCIYEPNYLSEQVEAIRKGNHVVGKPSITAFSLDKSMFLKIHNNNNNQMNFYGTIVFRTDVVEPAFEDIDDEKMVMQKFVLDHPDIYTTSDKNFILISRTLPDEINNKYVYEYDSTSCFKLMNHIFDKIYIIGLKHETIMKRCFISNNFMHNLKFTFWTAIYGKEDDECIRILNENINKKKGIRRIGEVGCMMSHINIFKEAKMNKYERIIVFEDDALLCKNFCERFMKTYMKIPCDWNIIRLGSTWNTLKMNLTYINGFKDGYYVTKPDTVGAFAISYKCNCLDKIIESAETFDSPYDKIPLNCIGRKDYTLYPNLVIADLFRSDTSGISRTLYSGASLLKWDLDMFHFVCTIRKVSVVAYPSKNIIEILNSLLRQTYFNIEIIIIDNPEIDSYCELVNPYLNKDLIYVKHECDVKKMISGAYIINWKSDNILENNAIELEVDDVLHNKQL